MKKALFISTVFILFSTGISCSKEDAVSPEKVTYSEENYLQGYMHLSGFNETTYIGIGGNDKEIGIEFTPLVNGVIKSLSVKLPERNHNFRVTIWDAATKTVLKTLTFDVDSPNTKYEFDINDFALIKNKEYTMTMNTHDWYLRQKLDYTNASYPITVGNIRINNYKYTNGSSQAYPMEVHHDFFLGDISFNFLQVD